MLCRKHWLAMSPIGANRTDSCSSKSDSHRTKGKSKRPEQSGLSLFFGRPCRFTTTPLSQRWCECARELFTLPAYTEHPCVSDIRAGSLMPRCASSQRSSRPPAGGRRPAVTERQRPAGGVGAPRRRACGRDHQTRDCKAQDLAGQASLTDSVKLIADGVLSGR